MVLRIGGMLKFRSFSLTALAIYFGVQFAAVTLDYFEVKGLEGSACSAVKTGLQTGAVREVLDYASSFLRLARPGRPIHLSLREKDSASEIGSSIQWPIQHVCTPPGREGVSLVLDVSRRSFNHNWAWIILASFFATFFCILALSSLRKKTESLTMALVEKEVLRVAGEREPVSARRPWLSRFYDQSKSDLTEQVRKKIENLKLSLDLQSEQIRKQEIKAALGELVAQVAHDMRSPLSLLSIIAKRGAGEESNELIAQAVERLNGLAEDILSTRRNLAAKHDQFCEIGGSVEKLIRFYRATNPQKISFRRPEGEYFIHSSETSLMRVLTILFDNARDAMGASGAIELTIEASRESKKTLSISVRDHGLGFPSEFLNGDPDQWVTTKAKGNGLGLKFAQNWTRQVGGLLVLSNMASGGAQVKITIPYLSRIDANSGQHMIV